MENILYITSDFKYQKSVKKFNSSVNKYKKIIIESSMNSGNAFFLNSLKCIGEVIVAFGEKEAMLAISQHRYSIIVFDLKIFFSAININFLERVDKICKKKILFIGFDGNFSKVLNITSLCEIISFNSIYVSNLLSDLSNYNLPSKLNDIIKPTYLGLGYLDISYDNKNKIFQNLPKLNEEKLKFDLFFFWLTGPF